MRHRFAPVLALGVALLVGLLAAPADASSRSCNTTLVNQQICRSTDHLVLFYDAPGAAFADLRDAILEEYSYSDMLVCTTARQFEALLNGQPSKVVSSAGQAQGDCTTVGAVAPNPQGTAEFADAVIDLELRNRVIAWKHAQAQAASSDPTSIPTPDVGGQ